MKPCQVLNENLCCMPKKLKQKHNNSSVLKALETRIESCSGFTLDPELIQSQIFVQLENAA